MNGQLPAVIAIGGGIYVLSQTQATVPVLPPMLPPGGSTVVPPVDNMGLNGPLTPDQSAKIDALLSAAADKYTNQMSQEAKNQAASYINETINPQPPLTGNESWQQVSSILGGAAGGALGGPLGAIAGAYLGTTLEGWLGSDLQSIYDWAKQNGLSAVNDVLGDVKDWLGL